MLKILCVCGARPNFIKVASIMKELRRRDHIDSRLIHTGQHYDERMSRLFFDELAIPKPDADLEVGSASHAVQTAEVMKRFEPICVEFQPDWVVVVGDVNSTVACALVATKLGIKVAHVEAGLRSFDRGMPEEINRVVTDAISDRLYVTEQSGIENLKREGVADETVCFAGNVMIDTLLACRSRADASGILTELELSPKTYAAVTLHRPSNVDDTDAFNSILDAFEVIAKEMPIIFPIHPRSRANLASKGLEPRVAQIGQLRLIEPLGYLDFMKLISAAAVVLTDSGGIQEETTILNVPCLTLRKNTERPVTITHGTNRLTGNDSESILQAYRELRDRPPHNAAAPDLWDGQAAKRIVDHLTGDHP